LSLRPILLISGSLRRSSGNTALLRTIHRDAGPGLPTVLCDRLGDLPHFDPDLDRDPLPPAVAQLRASIHDSRALLFCTPEYAGALPGSFKNLLDWTIGDDQPDSIYEKPVAWLNASTSPMGAADALESLRTVLRFAHATVVDAACIRIPIERHAVGEDGFVSDPSARARALAALDLLATAAP
jgi:NAD(P)H-dependent FMN reductase